MNHRLLLLFCLLWLAARTPAGANNPSPLPTLTREPTTTATINRRLP